MYIPKHFTEDDKGKVFAFIRENNFAQLISRVEGKLFCTHVPCLLENDGETILCHLAKQNPQWQQIEQQEVLLTFLGAHDYISPSWYNNPGVPTWNYQAVHVYGTCSVVGEDSKLKRMLDHLTRFHEQAFENPWQAQYSDDLLKAIVGIEIKVNDILCKYKLSQNRTRHERERVIAALHEQGSLALAKAMKENE